MSMKKCPLQVRTAVVGGVCEVYEHACLEF